MRKPPETTKPALAGAGFKESFAPNIELPLGDPMSNIEPPLGDPMSNIEPPLGDPMSVPQSLPSNTPGTLAAPASWRSLLLLGNATLSAEAKLTAAVLAEVALPDGRTSPLQLSTLALFAGLAEEDFASAVQELASRGLLDADRDVHPGAYRLIWAEGMVKA